jgi:Domain of unknown function (DUF4262)
MAVGGRGTPPCGRVAGALRPAEAPEWTVSRACRLVFLSCRGTEVVEEEIAKVVREHGWYAASVFDHEPPFLYSIGLMQTLNHPEFIIFGLEAATAHDFVSGLVRDIRNGGRFVEPGVRTVALTRGDQRVGFRRVHPTQHPLYLGFAMGYCRHIGRIGALEAVQVFWPDGSDRFPFDVGCDLAVYRLQPRLDIGLTPREVQEWQRQWK